MELGDESRFNELISTFVHSFLLYRTYTLCEQVLAASLHVMYFMNRTSFQR